MKRWIKWLNKIPLWQKILLCIILCFDIAFSYIAIFNTDTTPATEYDYAQLEAQAYEIIQNHNLLLQSHCNIQITDAEISVVFENSECELTVVYDKEFNILSTERSDKRLPWYFIVSLLLFIWMTSIGVFNCLTDFSKDY